MLKGIFLLVAFSTAFFDPAVDDQEFWPIFENPSDLSGAANIGEMLNNEAAWGPDQNLFMDNPATAGEYLEMEPQLNSAEVNNNNGFLAGLGSPSEPFDLLDPFGFENKAGPPEPNLLPPLDFPIPDCDGRYLLCCTGKPFGAGLYSKCDWCMSFNPNEHGVQTQVVELK